MNCPWVNKDYLSIYLIKSFFDHLQSQFFFHSNVAGVSYDFFIRTCSSEALHVPLWIKKLGNVELCESNFPAVAIVVFVADSRSEWSGQFCDIHTGGISKGLSGY